MISTQLYINDRYNIITQMNNYLKQFCLLSIIIGVCMGVPTEDLVTKDIGVNYTLPWYSGYLDFEMGSFHYTFFDSQNDPDNDPLVLWLNGGPGCSSLIGMVYENGPFVFIPNTTQFVWNPYAWNKNANLLYITSPGGVGFSKGSRQIYDDGNTADDNLQALLAFFSKFPNLKKNDFYLTGQSYSGIYVPYLAHKILEFNKLPSSKDKIILLKGIMVGNACTHPKQCYDATAQGNSLYQYQFLYNHGFYQQKSYNDLISACALSFFSFQCVQMRNLFDHLFERTSTSILNIYAPCYYQDDNKSKKKSQRIHKPINVGSDLDCGDSRGIHFFFNQPGIHLDLHVDDIKFQQCSDDVADTYESFANASYWIYPELIKQNLRVWVYSGDVDADVPITGTIAWLLMYRQEHHLQVMSKWRQWRVPGKSKGQDQVGGMTWQLRGITFASIKGAGHMVPHDKPRQAQILLQGFLAGTALPQKIDD